MKNLKPLRLAIVLTMLNGVLCSAQTRPTKIELATAYEKVMQGKDCADNLDAANELISTLSGIIDNLNESIRLNIGYIQDLTDENTRLANENYSLIASTTKKETKMKYSKPFGIGLYAGYDPIVNKPSVGFGITYSPNFLRF